jgi:regulator of ribonuclease activity A
MKPNGETIPEFKTTDLCDAYEDKLQVLEPLLKDFGALSAFYGPISTVRCVDDNSLVRSAFETQGRGRVLVVDGGGSLRCALIGDQLAALAANNGWAGAIVFGCVRDSVALARTKLGIKAVAAHPRKSVKRGLGERDLEVRFGGVIFTPGHYLYADEDGLVVSSGSLLT